MANNNITSSLTNIDTVQYAESVLNKNFITLGTEVDNKLSKTCPENNEMETPLDMNSNRILNLPNASSPTEPVPLSQLNALISAINAGGGGGSVELNDLSQSVVWTDIPPSNVPEAAVTQHEGALEITESQISDLQPYLTTVTEEAVLAHQEALTITESQISDLGTYPTQLSDLTDVANAIKFNRNVLVANGVSFQSRPLVEADISNLQNYLTDTPGSVSISNLTSTGTPSSSTFLRGDNTWAAPAGGGGGDLLAANNLSDLASAPTARTNLGVEIGADVQAHDLVLDNTTASYTTAEETKLAGIETAATADQTGEEIVTAIDAAIGNTDWQIGGSVVETNDLTTSVTWDDIPAANVPEAAVTQHEAALGIGWSQLSGIPTPVSSTTAPFTTLEKNKLAGIEEGAEVNVAIPLVQEVVEEQTSLTTGTELTTFRMPYGFILTEVRASVSTAPTGAPIIIDINDSGASILSTKLSIDPTEKTSVTAATPAVISNDTLADDTEITIDVDQIGSTVPGSGLKVTFLGTPADNTTGVIRLSSVSTTVDERATFNLTAVRSGGTVGIATADWGLLQPALVVGAGSGTFTWANGESGSKTVTLTTESVASDIGTFMALTNVTGASVGNPESGTLFINALAPSIASLTPNTGDDTGGTVVSVTGLDFTGTTGVTVGGVAATSVTVNSDTSLTFTTPAGTAGNQDVVITNNIGASASETFTYTPAAVPGVITLTTTNITVDERDTFNLTATRTVGTDGIATADWGLLDQALVEETGAGTFSWADGEGGAKSVTLTAGSFPSGDSTFVALLSSTGATIGNPDSGVLTITSLAPSITSLTPNTGTDAGGTTVTVAGLDFTGTTDVTVGGIAATGVTVNSDIELEFTTPAGTIGGEDVIITTPMGASAPATFTYTSPSSAYSVSDAIVGLPFAISTPAPPVTSGPDEVITTDGELDTLISSGINGKVVRLDGTFGNRSFPVMTDVHFILEDATDFGSFSLPPGTARILMEGVTPRTATTGYIRLGFPAYTSGGSGSGHVTDVEFRNFRQVHKRIGAVDAPFNLTIHANWLLAQRAAYIGMSMEGWMYTCVAFSDNTIGRNCNDIIFGNSYVRQLAGQTPGLSVTEQGLTTEPCFRTQGARRFVVADSRIRAELPFPGESDKQIFRIHSNNGNGVDQNAQDHYVVRNQFESLSAGLSIQNSADGSANPPMERIYFHDNDIYHDNTNSTLINVGGGGAGVATWPVQFSVLRNRAWHANSNSGTAALFPNPSGPNALGAPYSWSVPDTGPDANLGTGHLASNDMPTPAVWTYADGSPSSRYSVADAVADWPGGATWGTFNTPTVPSLTDFAATPVTPAAPGAFATGSNAHYVLGAGDYTSGPTGSRVTISGTNKIIELADGAILGSIVLADGASNIWFYSTNPRMSYIYSVERQFGSAVFEDIVFDGLNIDDSITLASPPTATANEGVYAGNRMAHIGCHIRQGRRFAMFASMNDQVSDFLVGNCLIDKWDTGAVGTHPFRAQGINRLMFVDSWAMGVIGQFRIHCGGVSASDLSYVLRSDLDCVSGHQIRGNGSPPGQFTPRFGRIRCEDTTWRRDGSILPPNNMGISEQDQPLDLEFVNNTANGGTWGTELQTGASIPTGSNSWSVSGAVNSGTYVPLDPANFVWL